MPQIALEPWPSCQNHVMRPKVAESDTRFSSSAFAASTTERNARASRMNVSTAMIANISGKLPKTACE